MIRAHDRGKVHILIDMYKKLECFDLADHFLAETLFQTATDEIIACMGRQTEPDGTPWPPLSHDYDQWKQVAAPGKPMGVLYGLMSEYWQIEGTRTITSQQATMTYGTDPRAQQEAVKFTYGGLITGTTQPPRKFYGLTTYAIYSCDMALEARYARYF